MKESQKPGPMVEFRDCALVELSDITATFGIELQEVRCAVCKRPARFFICGTVDGCYRFADYEPKDDGIGSVIMLLRSEFGSNFEMPVCDSHAMGLSQ